MSATVEAAAEQVLVAHQRHRGGCLCGWDELGRSHPAHQAAMLVQAGLLAGDVPPDPPPAPPRRPLSWPCASSRAAFASLRLVLDPPMQGGPLLTANGPQGYQVGIQLDPAALAGLLELGATCEAALKALVDRGPDRRGPFDEYEHPDVVELVRPAKGTVRAAAGGFVSAHVRRLHRDWVCEVFVSASNGNYSVFLRPFQWSEFLQALGSAADVAA